MLRSRLPEGEKCLTEVNNEEGSGGDGGGDSSSNRPFLGPRWKRFSGSGLPRKAPNRRPRFFPATFSREMKRNKNFHNFSLGLFFSLLVWEMRSCPSKKVSSGKLNFWNFCNLLSIWNLMNIPVILKVRFRKKNPVNINFSFMSCWFFPLFPGHCTFVH